MNAEDMNAQGARPQAAATPRTIDAQGGLDAERSRRLTGQTAIDLAVLAGLSLIAVLGFGAAYRGWGFLLAAAGGLLVGGGAALLAHRLRLNLLNTVLIAVAAYFLLGTGFAMPGSGFLGVLPTLQTLWALAVGAVDSWRDAVTLAAPIESPAHMGALPYLATALAMLASWLIALRWLPRRPGSGASAAVAVIPPAILFLLSLVIGTHEPFWGVARSDPVPRPHVDELDVRHVLAGLFPHLADEPGPRVLALVEPATGKGPPARGRPHLLRQLGQQHPALGLHERVGRDPLPDPGQLTGRQADVLVALDRR